MAIKTVGTQTFLSSNNVSINLAHIVSVEERIGTRYYTEEENASDVTLTEEELILEVFEVETIKDTFYFSKLPGRVAISEHRGQSTRVDSNVVEELKELF